jgi:flagellar motor protein MotB
MADLTPPEAFRAAADATRSRVDLFGKTLAALATLGTTAVGLTKVGDLFPNDGHEAWAWAAVIGLALAALAALAVAVRLMDAGNPDEIQVDNTQALSQPIFLAAAGRFGFKTLSGLQERERGLRAAAARAADDDERTRRTALADEIKLEIDTALARAQMLNNRQLATNAVSDGGAKAAYAAVIMGLLLFALGADAVSSDRTDATAAAKACGDARKAGATATELARAHEVCDAEEAKPDPTPQPPTAAQARADIAGQLTEVLKACTALVPDGGSTEGKPLATKDCAPIRDALPEVLAEK